MGMSGAKEAALAGLRPEKHRGFEWVLRVRRNLLYMGKSSDFLWAEQVGKARENVAKNEILKVRHGAKKCHLTTDKVFVLNQTFT